jgi:hypothetical protein
VKQSQPKRVAVLLPVGFELMTRTWWETETDVELNSLWNECRFKLVAVESKVKLELELELENVADPGLKSRPSTQN